MRFELQCVLNVTLDILYTAHKKANGNGIIYVIELKSNT